MTPAERILVDTKGAAELLCISPRHLQAMDNAGRLGPRGSMLGRSKRFSVGELKAWAAAGCPPRDVWLEQQAQQAGTIRLAERADE